MRLLSLLLTFLHFGGYDFVLARSSDCFKLSISDLVTNSQCPRHFAPQSFRTWRFDRHQDLATSFPLDPIAQNFVRQVPGCLFSVTYPIPLKSKLQLVAFSKPVLNDILGCCNLRSRVCGICEWLSHFAWFSPFVTQVWRAPVRILVGTVGRWEGGHAGEVCQSPR